MVGTVEAAPQELESQAPVLALTFIAVCHLGQGSSSLHVKVFSSKTDTKPILPIFH